MGTRVSINKLCRGCMNVLSNEDEKCSFCGFDRNEYIVVKEQLRLDCILKGKYLVGACIKDTENYKTYAGWNLSYDTKVVITEYFPKSIVIREDHESGQVIVKKNISPEVFKKNISKFVSQAELLSFDPNKKINITESFQENGTAYYIVECLKEDPAQGKAEVDAIADYELIKASDYDKPQMVGEHEEPFVRNAGLSGGFIPQPAFHVQPAMSEQKGTIVKNVASNVLSGASVSYEKTTRPKTLGVQYVDIELDENSLNMPEKKEDASSTVTFSKATSNTAKVSQTESDKPQVAKPDINFENIKKSIIENKTVAIAGVVIVIFIVIAIKIAIGGKGDEPQNADKTVAVATTATPTQTPQATTKVPEKEEASADDKKDESTDDKQEQSPNAGKAFEFTEKGGTLETSVCGIIGVDADKLKYDDIEAVKILDLSGCGVDDISDLSKFVNLKELNLSDNPIESIDALKKLKKLNKLTLTNCGLTDVSALNKMKKLSYVNVFGQNELVEQLSNIDYVVGRKNSVTVKFSYIRKNADYDKWSIWVWTAKDPGGELPFEVNSAETVTASKDYLLTTDNAIGFKLKCGDWELSDDIEEDRTFTCANNKPGTVVNVTVTQGESDVKVEYIEEK